MTEPRYLTYKEAATYLSTSVAALKKRVELGGIPVIKKGRWIRFDRFDLDAWMRADRIEKWSE